MPFVSGFSDISVSTPPFDEASVVATAALDSVEATIMVEEALWSALVLKVADPSLLLLAVAAAVLVAVVVETSGWSRRLLSRYSTATSKCEIWNLSGMVEWM